MYLHFAIEKSTIHVGRYTSPMDGRGNNWVARTFSIRLPINSPSSFRPDHHLSEIYPSPPQIQTNLKLAADDGCAVRSAKIHNS